MLLEPIERYALFQFLADKLGVSKEHVRQLERRAVEKLQAFADESRKDDFFGAATL